MSGELVRMVWMAQPPINPGDRSKVRRLPEGTYWFMARSFDRFGDAMQWAFWKADEDRTAKMRAWVARFRDFTELMARAHIANSAAARGEGGRP